MKQDLDVESFSILHWEFQFNIFELLKPRRFLQLANTQSGAPPSEFWQWWFPNHEKSTGSLGGGRSPPENFLQLLPLKSFWPPSKNLPNEWSKNEVQNFAGHSCMWVPKFISLKFLMCLKIFSWVPKFSWVSNFFHESQKFFHESH